MKGKEFKINPKSAIKRDKAVKRLDQLDAFLNDLEEKIKIINSRKSKIKAEILRQRKIVDANT